MGEAAKRSKLQANTNSQGVKRPAKPPATQDPQVLMYNFKIVALAHSRVKNNQDKYKGLYPYAKKAIDESRQTLKAIGLSDDKIKDLYGDATRNREQFMKRSTVKINDWHRERIIKRIKLGAIGTIAAGAITVASIIGLSSSNDSPDLAPDYTYSQDQGDEYDYQESQFTLEQFKEDYFDAARQQSRNALDTVRFMEGADDHFGSGWQTIGRLDGMSIGKLQHNFAVGAETANDLLRIFFRRYPESALSVFGQANLNKMQAVLQGSPREILDHMTRNFDHWEPIFRDRLLVNDDFLGLMQNDVDIRIGQAHRIAEQNGLNSALALEHTLNSNVLNGNGGATRRFSHLNSINRDQVTPEVARASLVQIFSDLHARHHSSGTNFSTSFQPDHGTFMSAKNTMINEMTDEAVVEYYLLVRVATQGNACTREFAILGLGGRVVGGEFQHGANAHPGKWFSPDLGKLDEPRMPETQQGLQDALRNSGLVQYRLEDGTVLLIPPSPEPRVENNNVETIRRE